MTQTEIFVFGSNLAGRHGRGAAREAYHKHGAVYGVGEGFMGRCYAIPTKDGWLKTLPKPVIQDAVERFLTFADSAMGKHYTFKVTRIGCGLAGYTDADIAPFFARAPANCLLPDVWVMLAP